MNGTSRRISAGVIIDSGSTPQAPPELIRRCSSCIRASPRATSIPPDRVSTPSSSYWRRLSAIRAVSTFV